MSPIAAAQHLMFLPFFLTSLHFHFHTPKGIARFLISGGAQFLFVGKYYVIENPIKPAASSPR